MAKAKKGGKSHRKLLMVGPDAPFQFVEAYKSLRTNLEFLSASSGCKVILITSSVPEEGKSNVAINLATTMAAGGKKVVLVDGDLRKGSLSRYLHLNRNRPGISNVVANQCTLTDALVRFKNVQFTLLPVGPLPPNPSEMLATPAVEALFKGLREYYDYVIVDTPPVSVVTDAAVMCRFADGAILVVRPGVTPTQGAQLSKKNLEAVHAHILGVVLNGYDAKRAGHKDGYYYSYSYDYYKHDDSAQAEDGEEGP
ncbi:CpsD/CapB family tyrosine-protein kinase [uncultured Subdoligranulum sp.]|uniref:CpsD/CapB family tyrosine-protein kinase n=1 Tax=uncultured Subdoligranulum sp. TaxID=512298 RepID=UPI0025D3C306|nr:CpsD/CapB family tyrosine-protein kinase [uncultured Subdoligranulum sp.]